jgi:phytanoyl-CoA hydroxylase
MIQTPRLSAEQVKFFHEEGYLIVPDIFDPKELIPLKQELHARIDHKIRELHAQGRLTHTYPDEPFETRAARIYADSRENGEAIMRDLEGLAGGGYTGPEMFKLITHSRLVAAIECIVGEEIVGSSVYRIRPKMPGKDSRGIVPWHQDSGYFSAHCDQHLIVTCWLPLVDATAHNGCMQILPRAHKQGIIRHYTGGHAGFLVIKDGDLPADTSKAITAECPAGGVVLMTNLTPHCSTVNHSDQVRWSLDLRYQSASAPNNVGFTPELDAEPAPDYLVACYPPEADFVVQSRRRPQSVTTYEEYLARRRHYDAVKNKAYPKRNWKPAEAAV